MLSMYRIRYHTHVRPFPGMSGFMAFAHDSGTGWLVKPPASNRAPEDANRSPSGADANSEM